MKASSPKRKKAPKTAAERLFDGVRAFQERIYPERRQEFEKLAEGQNPGTLFITCADSRVVPEMITQTDPGDLFVCRNIGNVVPSYGEMLGGVSAVVEYAVVALGVKNIVVCGHSDCGAMKALLRDNDPVLSAMPTVRSWLRNAQAARSIIEATRGELEGDAKLEALVEQNVLLQMQHLATHPSVAAALATEQVALHGWVYDIRNGEVRSYRADRHRFGALVDPKRSAATAKIDESEQAASPRTKPKASRVPATQQDLSQKRSQVAQNRQDGKQR